MTLPEVTPEIRAFGEKAKQVLGYDVLAEVQGRALGQLGPLAKVLAELEVEILDWPSVKRYQQKEAHRLEPQALEVDLSAREDSPSRRWFWMPHNRWSEIEISKYTKPIPEFVLNKAVQIKERLPEAELFIEEIEEVKDPFLLVKSGDEQFYVEVWEEPRFEGRLEK